VFASSLVFESFILTAEAVFLFIVGGVKLELN
jgi:hypothetical protein